MIVLEGIREFAMVAETGSFTKAARRLAVSTSHISKQVSALEDRLGVKLFSRSTRVVRLTEIGMDYQRRVLDALDGLAEASHIASSTNTVLAGKIRITAAGPFAEERVAPLLVEFAKEHPRVSIEMDFDTRFVNLVDQGFDFAIRYGTLPESGMIAKKLSGRAMACAATPAYLEKHGTPLHPNDLRRYPCLLANNGLWRFTDPKSGDAIEVRVSGHWRANSIFPLRHAAKHSLGIVYTPSINIESEIRAGELVPILKEFEDQSRSHWIVYPERRHMPLRVRKAIDHIAGAFGGRTDD
jgi:DNA-binding transcriptional LysR family regulator